MKISKKTRLALTLIRTIGAIILIAVGFFGLKYGCGWHNNVLSQINSDAAFAAVLILVIGGALLVFEGFYQLAPIFWTAFWAALFGDETAAKRKIVALKRRYLW